MVRVTGAFQQLHDIVEEVCPVWNRHFPDEAEEQNAAAYRKLNEEGVRVQIYGAYNAGKSTLINLLTGHEVAAVGEIPVTDAINYYDWNGIRLIDTPGVNAPIEHEEVTLQSLKENDLVVFVVRERDQDTADVYDRLLDCLKTSKKVFIILNYESLDPDGGENNGTELMERHVIEQLFKQSRNRSAQDLMESGTIESLRVLPINLIQAYKGRTEGKSALLNHSGYNEFIEQFNAWVKGHETETQLCARIRDHLDTYYVQPLIERLKIQQGSDDIEPQRTELAELQRLRDNTEIKANNESRKIALSHKTKLIRSLEGIDSESEAQDLLEQFMQQTCDQYQEALEKLLEKSVALKIKSGSVRYEADESGPQNQKLVDDLMNQGLDSLQNSSVLEEANLEPMIRSIIFKLRDSGYIFKTFSDDFIKGMAPKIAARGVVALQVATVAYNIYSSTKEQEQENERQRNRARKIKQAADSVAEHFMEEMKKQTAEVVDALFSSTISEANKALENHTDDVTQLQRDLVILDRARSQLLAVNIV